MFAAKHAFQTWGSDLIFVLSEMLTLSTCEAMLHAGQALSSHPAVKKVLTPQWSEEM